MEFITTEFCLKINFAGKNSGKLQHSISLAYLLNEGVKGTVYRSESGGSYAGG